jgi:hypothetical protein
LVAVAVAVGGCGSTPAAAPPANTVKVRKGALAAIVSVNGLLTYRAPSAVINRARGIYTKLPAAGDKVGCGDVLYRVDEDPVLLLCGTVPAYRDLRVGDKGKDVRQLNRNLHVGSREFTAKTQAALKTLHGSGALRLGDAVFLPGPVRIAKVIGTLGGSARAGAAVARVTSDTLEVLVHVEQGEVKAGDRARITLPGLASVRGTVARLGSVARARDATVPAYIRLEDPKRGLDRAPVQVDITTKGVENVLSVPVTALVGKAGGGFAVEVVRGGRRELVTVKLGLFAEGRVEVRGDLAAGDPVVVPSL